MKKISLTARYDSKLHILQSLFVELELIALFFAILFLSVCQMRGVDLFTLGALCLSVLIILIYIISYSRDKLVQNKKYIWGACLIASVVLTIALFYILSSHYKYKWENIGSDYLMYPFFFLFSLFIVTCLILFIIAIKRHLVGGTSSSSKYKKLILGAVYLSVVIALNFNWMDTWPQYDNYTYANDLNKIYLSDIFQANGLLVCGHVSDLFALLFLFFKILPINFINISYLLNIVLMFGDMLLFDAVLRRLFKSSSESFFVLATLMLGVSPAVFGSVHTVCPEKILFFGFLFYLYGYLSQNRPIQFLAAYIICTAKETGIVVIAVCTAIELLLKVITYLKNTHKDLRSYVTDITYFLCVLGIGILCLLRLLSNAWMSGTALGNERVSLDGHSWNSFALSLSQTICVLKATFLTNFTWIFLILFLAGLSKYIWNCLNKKIDRHQFKSDINKWIIIFMSCITSVFVLCIYITGVRWRYYAPVCVFIYLLGIGGFIYFSNNFRYKRIIRSACVFLIGCLLFIQSYFTIDPIMLRTFHTLDTGEARIAVMEQNCSWLYDITCNVATEYNQQMRTFTQALDQALSKVLTPDKSVCIAFSDEHKISDNNGALTSIWGLGYEYTDPPRWTHWDFDNQRRFLSDEKSGRIPVTYINVNTDLQEYLNEYDFLYYIEMPWADAVIDQKENVAFVDTTKHMGWELKIYQMFGEKSNEKESNGYY